MLRIYAQRPGHPGSAYEVGLSGSYLGKAMLNMFNMPGGCCGDKKEKPETTEAPTTPPPPASTSNVPPS